MIPAKLFPIRGQTNPLPLLFQGEDDSGLHISTMLSFGSFEIASLRSELKAYRNGREGHQRSLRGA
jgi:hypothetical protein